MYSKNKRQKQNGKYFSSAKKKNIDDENVYSIKSSSNFSIVLDV